MKFLERETLYHLLLSFFGKTLRNRVKEIYPPEVCTFFRGGVTQEHVADWVGLLSKETQEEVTWRRHKKNYIIHASGDVEKVRSAAARLSFELERNTKSGVGIAIILTDNGFASSN